MGLKLHSRETAMLVLVVAMCRGGWATIEFNDGGTHDITWTIPDLVWVDGGFPGARTTVNFLPGGGHARHYALSDGI